MSSGLIAKGKEFLDDWGGRIDLLVAVFSVLGETSVCVVPGWVAGGLACRMSCDQHSLLT